MVVRCVVLCWLVGFMVFVELLFVMLVVEFFFQCDYGQCCMGSKIVFVEFCFVGVSLGLCFVFNGQDIVVEWQ